MTRARISGVMNRLRTSVRESKTSSATRIPLQIRADNPADHGPAIVAIVQDRAYGATVQPDLGAEHALGRTEQPVQVADVVDHAAQNQVVRARDAFRHRRRIGEMERLSDEPSLLGSPF